VRIAVVLPEDAHPRIVHPIALTPGKNSGAARFLGFLESAAVKPIFEKQDFTVLP
jgi:molybdate transport system substrate-binding protein